MSATGPRYHIPFPSAFLSLNTPSHKKTSSGSGDVVTSPSEVAHRFLSNKPTVVPRHSSISSVGSVSSEGSVGSPPSSPPTKVADSPIAGQKAPTFLTLNSKHAAPPKVAQEMRHDAGGFLSNKY